MSITNPVSLPGVASSTSSLAPTAIPDGGKSQSSIAPGSEMHTVKFQQIRNATIKLEYAGTTFLVDPMLVRKDGYPGFPSPYNSHLRNPLVELPLPFGDVIKADAIVVTRTHADHWDEAAKSGLPKASQSSSRTKATPPVSEQMDLPTCACSQSTLFSTARK